MDDVKSLTGKRGWLSLAAILRDWAAIVGTAVLSLYVDHWAFYLAAVWVIGLFQFALGEGMLHEAAHYNLFKSRRLNHLGEIFYGLPFFCTVAQYQPEHRVHHAKLGDAEDKLVGEYRRFGLYGNKVNAAWLWFGKPVLGFPIYYVSLVTLRPWTEGVKIVAFWAVALATFYRFDLLHVLLLYWIVPLLWSNYAFVYWSEVENHYNTSSGTRTNVSRLYNLLTHNGGYHAVHHKYPSIPWFHLRAAHERFFPDCKDVSRGFLDTYRQLRRPLSRSLVPSFLPSAGADTVESTG
jgi:fatty acid desaturase